MIDKIIDIVNEASSLMIHSGFSIEQKEGIENIVTSSDIAVQNFLCDRLSGLIPGSGFICEEDSFRTPDREYVWIIDPIDGTTNYARGMDSCCISVALKHFDEVISGVVFSPWRKELFCAEKGGGAYLNGRPIHVSDKPFDQGVLFTAMSTYRKEYAGICSEIILDTFKQCNDFRRYGSAAMELCFIAAGLADLYFELRLQPWDHSAAILILEEAGGAATNLDGVHPDFNAPDLVCGGNSKENQRRLLEIIRRHITGLPYKD